MIEWHNPKVKLPNDGDECLLMPLDHGGLTTVGVYGPITWDADGGMWLDIFRDSDAGSCVPIDRVGLWTLWGPIKPSTRDVLR